MDEDIVVNDGEIGKAEFFLATVMDVRTVTKDVQICLDGDDARMTKWYKTACGSVPVGSRVVVMKISGTYVILGAINETTYKTDIQNVATAESGIVFRNGGYVARWGKVAMLYLRFGITTTFSSTAKKLITLNNGWRPAIDSDAQYWAGNGGFIDTYGGAWARGGASDTSGTYALYATYILA